MQSPTGVNSSGSRGDGNSVSNSRPKWIRSCNKVVVRSYLVREEKYFIEKVLKCSSEEWEKVWENSPKRDIEKEKGGRPLCVCESPSNEELSR